MKKRRPVKFAVVIFVAICAFGFFWHNGNRIKNMNLFKEKNELKGTIEIDGVPPFLGYNISLSLFRVKDPSAEWPFPNDIPPKARRTEHELAKINHFDQEDTTGVINVDFLLSCVASSYYLQLNVILYRKKNNEMYAQVERFPFAKRPIEIPPDVQRSIILPVSWPTIPIEDLGVYGIMKPGGSGRLY